MKSKELLRAHPGQMQIDSQKWILGISEFGENLYTSKHLPLKLDWLLPVGKQRPLLSPNNSFWELNNSTIKKIIKSNDWWI